MLERISVDFTPEKEAFSGSNIRFHHLVFWSDIVNLYHKRFDNPPWNLGDDELKKVRYRVGKQIAQTTDYFVERFKKYQDINDTMHESMDVQTRLRYLTDVLGRREETQKLVAQKWLDSELNLVMKIAENKDIEILLSRKEDGICNSCAVGRHCNVGTFEYLGFGGDSMYQKILLDILSDTDYWNDKGNFEILKNNDRVISGELLFDKQFLSVVENNLAIKYPHFIKSRML